MAAPPRKCATDTMYGYNVEDVVRVGGPSGKRGLQGLKGDPGKKGDPGLSAFLIAKLHGFPGNEIEWLESLKGADGEDGEDGGAIGDNETFNTNLALLYQLQKL